MRTIMWLSGGLSVGLGMVTLAYKASSNLPAT